MWFFLSNDSYTPRFRILRARIKRKVVSSSTRKKLPIKFKFARQQKILGKVTKVLSKKKTNSLLKNFRLYITTGVVQNLPPLSTMLSLYGINSQKLCDELNLFIKPRFFEGFPIIINLNIFKDFSFKFYFVGFKNIWLLRNLIFSSNQLIITKSSERIYYYDDLWFIVLLYLYMFSIYNFESFVKSLKKSFLTLMCSRFSKYKIYNYN